MIMKLFEKYVEFLDSNLKKLYSEICTISSVIKAKMPKPKPKPPKPPKEKYEPISLSCPKPAYHSFNVKIEKPKKNLDYLKEIQQDIIQIDKSYDNSSQSLTGTKYFHQGSISGTYQPNVMSASISIEDYLKSMYKKPGNMSKRASRILGEDEEPKPRKTRKLRHRGGRSITD